jgi:hypothetical protein
MIRVTAPILHRGGRAASILAVRLALVALFLALVARHYDRRTGFTSLIAFAEASHQDESPALQQVPHHHNPGRASYDGQFYAQMALDPFLRDPATDRLLDTTLRTRRMLCSASAWALGLGRPAWILEAYALQNVAVWLVLAWWLARRVPSDDWRALFVWVGCLCTAGLLGSVRLALPDGPSLLLVVLAVSAAERGRVKSAAAIAGIAVLARETNLLAAAALVPLLLARRRPVTDWLLAGVLLVLPAALWLDYLRSIYRASLVSSGGSLGAPFAAYIDQWRTFVHTAGTMHAALLTARLGSLLALLALTTQAAWFALRIRTASAWWWIGAAYAALMMVVSPAVFAGEPGAVTRVLLPMAWAFNLTLPDGRRFWPLWVAGNLTLVPGTVALL